MHINPIKSKPLSPEGRDNYDRIFRKKPFVAIPDELQELQDEYASQAWRDKQRDKARELYHELAQKHQDESA